MPVYQDSGPGLGAALSSGLQTFAAARQRKKADEMFEQEMTDRLNARNLQQAQLASQGIHLLGKGELPPTYLAKSIADDAGARAAATVPGVPELTFSPDGGAATMQAKAPISRAGAGVANIPGRPQASSGDLFQQTLASSLAGAAPNRGPRYEVGNGYWIDKQPQWDAQDAARANLQGEKLFEANIQSALADAALGRSKNLSQFNANVDVGKESALAPIRTAQAVNTERALAPIRTQQAIDTERGVGPLRTAQTVNAERLTAPIKVATAANIEAATLPGKLAVAEASAGNRPPTEGERKNAALLLSAEQGYNTLENLIKGGKGVPSWKDRQLSRVGMGAGNMMTGDEYRQLRQSALQLSDAWLRFTSGAAVPESEVERTAATFIPEPGDDPATLAQKAASRKTMLDALRVGAGRANAPVLAPRTAPMKDPGGNITFGGDTAGTTITVNGKTFKVPN